MLSQIAIDLFVEDSAHELFVSSLVSRICQIEHVNPSLTFRSARGGHPRVLSELKLLRRAFEVGGISLPQLLICVVDGNCIGFNKCRQEIEKILGDSLVQTSVVGCPDPHIERWLFADLDCFERLVGSRPSVAQRKCDRDYYKRLLENSVKRGDNTPLLGGLEYARPIVQSMDLYRAGQSEASLGHFINQIVSKLRLWRGIEEW